MQNHLSLLKFCREFVSDAENYLQTSAKWKSYVYNAYNYRKNVLPKVDALKKLQYFFSTKENDLGAFFLNSQGNLAVFPFVLTSRSCIVKRATMFLAVRLLGTFSVKVMKCYLQPSDLIHRSQTYVAAEYRSEVGKNVKNFFGLMWSADKLAPKQLKSFFIDFSCKFQNFKPEGGGVRVKLEIPNFYHVHFTSFCNFFHTPSPKTFEKKIKLKCPTLYVCLCIEEKGDCYGSL